MPGESSGFRCGNVFNARNVQNCAAPRMRNKAFCVRIKSNLNGISKNPRSVVIPDVVGVTARRLDSERAKGFFLHSFFKLARLEHARTLTQLNERRQAAPSVTPASRVGRGTRHGCLPGQGACCKDDQCQCAGGGDMPCSRATKKFSSSFPHQFSHNPRMRNKPSFTISGAAPKTNSHTSKTRTPRLHVLRSIRMPIGCNRKYASIDPKQLLPVTT